MRKRRIELDDTQARAAATEEFLLHLHRSTELLRANKHDDARRTLEDAFEAQSDDPTGRATLALVYFKLGLYPRALASYRRLVDEHPGDPVLALNLALVLFKTGQTAEARDVLSRVVALAPEYRKAYGYLGLAHQRLGDYRRAYEAFKRGGVEHMAERMSRFVDSEEEPAAPAPAEAEPDACQRPSAPPAFFTIPPAALAGGRGAATEPLPVADLLADARLDTPVAGRFLVAASGYLIADVAGTVRSRLEGLHFCASTGLVYRPLKRRRRRPEGDEGFRGGDGAVYEIEGTGRLGFHPRGGEFEAVTLDGEAAYVREERLFAFDPELEYENGRIPGSDIALVQLRGRGAVVLKCPRRPHALEITPDAGVIIPAGGLVGWFGRLLPRGVRGGPFDPSLNALELTGEGVLLFCLA
jgi:uncharacterized protein (AIM24 family)